jgi:hypothetical protein
MKPARPKLPPGPTTRDSIARNIHAVAVRVRAKGPGWHRIADSINDIAAAVKAGRL